MVNEVHERREIFLAVVYLEQGTHRRVRRLGRVIQGNVCGSGPSANALFHEEL